MSIQRYLALIIYPYDAIFVVYDITISFNGNDENICTTMEVVERAHLSIVILHTAPITTTGCQCQCC